METKIIKQEKNPFLQREEITIKIKNPNTPNAEEVKTAIGKNTTKSTNSKESEASENLGFLGKDPALTIIKKINTNFGKQTFTVEAVVYDNIEAKNKIETIPQKIRKKLEAEEKTEKEAEAKATAEAETKTEEPVQETPTEEPKPEEPVEAPKEETKPKENQNE